MDDVDGIVEAWNRERPDLDVRPLSVLSRVTRLARHLYLARTSAFAKHDLEGWELDVLAALRRSGNTYALYPGQLATQSMVTSGTLNISIDRLDARTFVQRQPDPTDRRGVRVELTDAGRLAVDGAFTDLLSHEQLLLESLSDAEQVVLADLLRDLMQQFTPLR